MKILLTGASGFIGKALHMSLLSDPNIGLSIASRRNTEFIGGNTRVFHCGDMSGKIDWTEALSGIDIVIHAAGHAHAGIQSSSDSLQLFRDVNVRSTLDLAMQAAHSGAHRFIFISSISVYGSGTKDVPLIEESKPSPESPYSISKYEAETGLRDIERTTGMQVVIIRPPLVYGPNPPGNLSIMLKAIFHHCPLPFASIKNRRTLVSLENLTSMVITCLHHPNAAGETFLAGDDCDVSTSEIVELLAKGMRRRAILFPVPDGILKFGATIAGKKHLYRQLCTSLQIDITKARSVLGWIPSANTFDGLVEVGRAYAELHH